MSQDPIIRDIHNNFQSAPDDEITCKCCGVKYTRGFWDFYNLCTPCFKVFDAQKMRRRWGLAGQFLRTGNMNLADVPIAATEDVVEFIKAKVCPHK